MAELDLTWQHEFNDHFSEEVAGTSERGTVVLAARRRARPQPPGTRISISALGSPEITASSSFSAVPGAKSTRPTSAGAGVQRMSTAAVPSKVISLALADMVPE